MSGHTQGGPRNRMVQKEAHRMSLLARMTPHAYTSQLYAQESTNEALREHGLPSRSLHLRTAYASNLPTPATIKKAYESDYSQLRWNSRVWESRCLFQARTFEPVL